MTERAVHARGLGRRFRDLTAVEDLSFDVRAGELFGLVGPDGAGKTTTLRMLAGVLPPTEGDASVFGTSVAGDPEAMKRDIAYMPQRFGLYTDLTVRENLDFYANLFRVPRDEREPRIERLHAFSGLGPFEDRLAGDLSGGMKQKLGLSCALVHDPRLLLLDEPTFGVDPISRRDLWLIVHEMVARGVTVIVSTAYMDEAERFDRLALLHGGRITALDTPSELRGALRGRVLAVWTDRLRSARDVLRDVDVVWSASVFGDRLHVIVPEAEAARSTLETALVEAGFAHVRAEAVEPSMEDVFMHHVSGKERSDAG